MLHQVPSSKRCQFPTSALHVISLAALLAMVPSSIVAQDTRQVTEPTFPATCQSLPAELSVGSSGEPSSETAFDTARIQAALNACAGTGQAVELTTSGSNNAFLIQPITIPTGVTLLVDGGVTVFASRNPADYQVGTPSSSQALCTSDNTIEPAQPTCGTVNAGNPLGCKDLIYSGGATNGQGIMGFGIIDGRGGDPLLSNGVAQSCSWWDLNHLAQHSAAVPTYASVPELIDFRGANNLTLYKITLLNSQLFHFKLYGTTPTLTSGLTVWGVKVLSPYDRINTDGIDACCGVENITIANSYISDGDDMINLAAGGVGAPVTNVSIKNMHTYDGAGISINGGTQGGASNFLVDTISQQGTINPSSYGQHPSYGLKIQTGAADGGLVNNITYQNVCMQNEGAYVYLDTNGSSSGTSYPTLRDVTLRNLTILKATANNGWIALQGYSAANPLSLSLDNVQIQSGVTPNYTQYPPQYADITLGPGPVAASLQSLTGTGVSYGGQITNPTEAAYSCSSANFPLLAGELYASTSSSTNQETLALTYPAAFTLNAVVIPTTVDAEASPGTSVGTTAQPLTSTITFYDSTTAVGTAGVTGNGTLANLGLSNVAAGTHTYSAVYPTDTYHPTATSFGSLVVYVAPASTDTQLSLSTGQVLVGGSVGLTATVTSVAGTPASGIVTFLHGATSFGSATVNGSGIATLTLSNLQGGTDSITASYEGAGNFASSISTAQTLTVFTSPVTLALNPSLLTLAGGGNGTSTLTITPVAGFTGAVTIGCSSPVTYINCVTTTPATITGTSAVTSTIKIAISSTASELRLPHRRSIGSGLTIALMLPVGPAWLILLARRRSWGARAHQGSSLLILFYLAGILMMATSGCGSAGAGSSLSNPPPTGSQAVNVTATAANNTVSAQLTVNVSN